MKKATNQWLNDYNWREWEAKFNDLPQYTIDVLDNDQTHTYSYTVGLDLSLSFCLYFAIFVRHTQPAQTP
ncbi:hypothetical protein DBV05_g12652 [Lasiodiplodia theobromae]|uniref:Epoxide hydrolase N-terminal domain-containing protein n=1 Tax=Lasiodiplodia theobromae TaxID=45133 RepID=A0A5N5CTJ4_9PEZI|nr:hypothetical protein DBV05_g12652 [Lasiodiplodia theobromae]